MTRGECSLRVAPGPARPAAAAPVAATRCGVADPFGERAAVAQRLQMDLLGVRFRFEATNRALLGIVKRAYQRLPSHRFAGAAPIVTVRLIATVDDPGLRWREPPPLRTVAGGGLVAGTMDAANFAVLTPAARTGLVAVSSRMRHFDYHARYELLEFAVFTLAARVQSLVPLHAACLGARGRAVLLLGDTGAGKSTLALHGLLGGLEFTSEDSSFVCPARMLVTGVANFVHVRTDALALIEDPSVRTRIRRSPVIRRRSGVDKFEIDVRGALPARAGAIDDRRGRLPVAAAGAARGAAAAAERRARCGAPRRDPAIRRRPARLAALRRQPGGRRMRGVAPRHRRGVGRRRAPAARRGMNMPAGAWA